MRILLCEDNKEMASQIEDIIYSEFLGEELCFIHLAENGCKALEIAQLYYIDIFIIDLGLPDIDGLTLAIKIRKKYRFQPIIIESVCSDSQKKEMIHDKISYYAFLSKPFDKKNFLNKFRSALELSKHVNQKKLSIKINNNNYFNFDINDIICIKKINSVKKIEIISYDSGLHRHTLYYSLRKILELVNADNSLVQVHKSFLINPDYIQQICIYDSLIFLRHLNDPISIGPKYKYILENFMEEQ